MSDRNLTNTMKKLLWQRYGSQQYPAEWDGIHFGGGGGKLSQRFWEYFRAIELLDLDKNSVVLDIGGWSNDQGAGFLGRILAQAVKKVIIIDPSIKDHNEIPANMELISDDASMTSLKKIFETHPDLTHVVSVSVMEHIQTLLRKEIVDAVNAYFKGNVFVVTYEYHTKRCFFENQLTVKAVSDLFKDMKNFFPTVFESAPVFAENAYANLFYKSANKKVFKFLDKMFTKTIPLWYPVIVKFERNE